MTGQILKRSERRVNWVRVLWRKFYNLLRGNNAYGNFHDRQDLIYNFLLNREPNHEGLYLFEIWKFSSIELENTHNYIQWMFPTAEKSHYNRRAPVIEDVEVFLNHPDREEIVINIRKSFYLMLNFYGLELKQDKIVKGTNYESRRRWWVTYNNHNYLRITRILKCLDLFLLSNEKLLFTEILNTIYNENKGVISEETYAYWMSA